MTESQPNPTFDSDDVRSTLDRLIGERGLSYAAISQMLGRNQAYIHQFIHRGSPQKLAEDDRRFLAEFLGVDEKLLGASLAARISGKALVGARRGRGVDADTEMRRIPRLSVGASAGQGALTDNEHAIGQIAFDRSWLRKQGLGKAQLSMIRVDGDSMEPTLRDGDDIMVALTGDTEHRRDGIYVLRMDETLMVKRISFGPDSRLSIISDNHVYPPRHGLTREQTHIVGRVVWAGRMV